MEKVILRFATKEEAELDLDYDILFTPSGPKKYFN